tara:strand:- start:3223 stop:5169 length:1947 start_codon:yes stop_codon:yes gene_type:complete
MNEWHVSDLLNNNRSLERPNPSDDDIMRMVNQLHDEWVPSDEDNEPAPQPADMINWCANKFSMDLNSFTFEELVTNYKRKQYQLYNLATLVRNSPDLTEDAHTKDMILRIGNCTKGCFDCLWNTALLYYRMDPGRELRVPPEASIENIFNFNEDKLNNFQKLLIHVTKLLEAAEYRKIDDQCWVQIKNSYGMPTHAWKMAIEIKKYIFTMIQKEVDFVNWQYLTNPQDNADKLVKHLVDSEQANFPTLEVDRHKWSYDNGIYDTETDTFWVFGEEHLWEEQAQKIQEYRINKGWGENYKVTPPDGMKMTVKYFEQPFRFIITPETEESFDAHKIILPEMDKVLDSQKLETATKDWVLIMLARLFFKVGEKDKWQVVFFIKGVAGSGKSTLAKLIRYMYPSNFITTLSSNVEAKFGLSAIYKGLICICAEVREEFGLDQADWQSAASGEELSIAIKNKTAISHLWDTPFFFLGNEVPNYKNASGSVDRRIFMIEFNVKIRGSDPYLFDKLVSNLDLFHRKSVSLYLAEIRANGNKDIWSSTPNLLPQQIYDFKNNMRSSVDCLFNFLNSPTFEFDPEFSMPVADFKELYAAHRKANGEEKCRWNKEHFSSTFAELGIFVTKAQTTTGKRNSEMIKGMRLRNDELRSDDL